MGSYSAQDRAPAPSGQRWWEWQCQEASERARSESQGRAAFSLNRKGKDRVLSSTRLYQPGQAWCGGQVHLVQSLPEPNPKTDYSCPVPPLCQEEPNGEHKASQGRPLPNRPFTPRLPAWRGPSLGDRCISPFN